MRVGYAKHLLIALACLPMLAWTVDLLAGTSPIIVLAALVPAAAHAGVILLLQRGGGRRPARLAFALAWGAVGAAFLSSNTNVLAREWLDLFVGADDVRAATATFAAPVIEEAVKALGLGLMLWLWADTIRGPSDGIVYGALIGVGFVVTENVLYLGLAVLSGGEAALIRAAYLRGVLGGATHAIFTAAVGAGIGWARGAGRMPALVVAPALGATAALTLHVAWNAFAAGILVGVICDAEFEGGACRDVPTTEALFGWATLVAVVFLAPAVLGLLAVSRVRIARAESATPSATPQT